jgi:hypothetical protein
MKLGQAQQAMLGVTQGGIVRNAIQSEHCAQISEVPQVLGDAPIVRLKELHQNQTGEQLRLRIQAWREFGGIGWERLCPMCKAARASANGELLMGRVGMCCLITHSILSTNHRFSTEHQHHNKISQSGVLQRFTNLMTFSASTASRRVFGDYANLTEVLLALYQTVTQADSLRRANSWMRCWTISRTRAGILDTSDAAEKLIARRKDLQDNAVR